jgi:hypothetical protein
MYSKKSIIVLASIIAPMMAMTSMAAAQETLPELPRTQKLDPDKATSLPDSLGTLCTRPDLVLAEEFAVTEQSVDIESKEMVLKFAAILDNIGSCDAKESRTKARLTLQGGRWIGQDKYDVAVNAGDYAVVSFEITFPYEDLMVDCTISRSDWKLTLNADWREAIDELDESNNQREYSFSTATSNLCPIHPRRELPIKGL